MTGSFSSFADFGQYLKRRPRRPLPAASGLVLLHMTKLGSYQVVHAHFAAALSDLTGLTTAAYRIDDRRESRGGPLGWVRGLLLGEEPNSLDVVYRDLVDEVIVLRVSGAVRREARREVDRYLSSQPSRRDLERFSVRGIAIGDLVYDKFIQKGHPVVDPCDPELRRHLLRFAVHAIALDDFCASRSVQWFVSGASAHEPGIPSRVAAKRASPAIVATQDFAVRLSPHRPIWNLDSVFYRDRFARLPAARQRDLLEGSDRFLSGLVSSGEVDLSATGQRPWAVGERLDPGLVVDRSRPRILVAVHSFYDDPHAAGIGLFPDFYSWLEHLVELMPRCDYEWLIKLHPDQRDDQIGVRPAIERLLVDRPQARILPEGVGHRELLESGIDLALTIYGTIGFEYPAAGVPVLTAGPLNPHRPYSYCLHAETVEQYDGCLLNPREWQYAIPRDDLREYVAMHYLQEADFPFHEIPFVRRHLEESGDFFKAAEFPDLWAREVTSTDVEAIIVKVRDWIASGTYGFRAFLADRASADGSADGEGLVR